jgi:hypothetical protein
LRKCWKVLIFLIRDTLYEREVLVFVDTASQSKGFIWIGVGIMAQGAIAFNVDIPLDAVELFLRCVGEFTKERVVLSE